MNKHEYLEQVKVAAFEDEIQKIAKEEYSERPGYQDSLIAQYRATRAKPKGLGQFMSDPDMDTKQLKNILIGGGIGAGGGAALGSLLSLAAKKGKRGKVGAIGAGIGSAAGLLAGGSVGEYRGKSKYLKTKGIERKGVKGLLGFVNMTPEARKKYLGEI